MKNTMSRQGKMKFYLLHTSLQISEVYEVPRHGPLGQLVHVVVFNPGAECLVNLRVEACS